jgi:hypothetical protein
MDNKETVKGLSNTDILLYNEDYFKYIFKKTEKIVTAVFYTTRSLNDIDQSDRVIALLEDKATRLLETCEKTLRAPETARRLRLEELRIALIGLESALTVGSGARVVALTILEVFRHELNSVHRALKEYGKESLKNPFETEGGVSFDERSRRRMITGRTGGVTTAPTGSVVVDASAGRKEKILAIIKDKGQASIKDVSSVISDCSEKTIQRELMSLISEGLITKQGERRWSRYSVV